MFIFLNKKKGQRSGFTLIELLVVIAIIGVLASIVLASLNNARRKSRDARRVTDIKQTQLALELYFDSYSEYPDTLAVGTGAGYIAPAFIPVVPDDPLTGAAPNDYMYVAFSTSVGTVCPAGATCLYYHLGGNLEDSTTPGLQSDADRCPSPGIAGAKPTGCTTLTGTTINGENADGCTNEDGRFCYDVTP